jgi:hypothetical protein
MSVMVGDDGLMKMSVSEEEKVEGGGCVWVVGLVGEEEVGGGGEEEEDAAAEARGSLRAGHLIRLIVPAGVGEADEEGGGGDEEEQLHLVLLSSPFFFLPGLA